MLKIPFIVQIFAYLSEGVTALQAATQEGAEFVFGYLSNSSNSPFESSGMGNSMIFAFQILPLIIVISSLSALLWFWNILPLIIRAISKVFEKFVLVITLARVFLSFVITIPPSIIEKIMFFGKTFNYLTINTVKNFLTDSKKSNFKI